MNKSFSIILSLLFVFVGMGFSSNFGQRLFTLSTPHFNISYPDGNQRTAREVGAILEELDSVYRTVYQVAIPLKTEVIITNDDPGLGNGFSSASGNIINIYVNSMDFNLRGSHPWLRDVVTHEFAHHYSIWIALRYPQFIPYLQVGYFDHPNSTGRIEGMHIIPGDILPHWFTEGIAQYESTRHQADTWDAHRDMVLRSMVLSRTLLSPQHMGVFAGRGIDFERTYNQGFSLTAYMVNRYGYDRVVSLLRESAKFSQFSFDNALHSVLGVSMNTLYRHWKDSLELHYTAQVKALGKQVYGRKLNKEGFDNLWPRFSPHDKRIYFLSNGRADYSFSFLGLYSYNYSDTVKDTNRVRKESAVNAPYDLSRLDRRILFSSVHSPESELPMHQGGWRTRDLFYDTLPPEKKVFIPPWHKTDRQISKKKSLFAGALSPSGNRIAALKRQKDQFFLVLLDTAGTEIRRLFPTVDSVRIQYMYSVDWSGDGHRIAISFLENNDRDIGIYDTLDRSFKTVCKTTSDERDPRFNPAGTQLCFAAERQGIFNIFRYQFEQHSLQQLTNVSGGAFMPDLSARNQLAYANFDSAGYSIYLIDSVAVIREQVVDSGYTDYHYGNFRPPLSGGTTTPYSFLPRQLSVIPTLFTEAAVSRSDNPFAGVPVLKGGVVLNVLDPFGWVEQGTELGGYFLFEPEKIFQFFNLNRGIIDPYRNWDAGIFGRTNLLPVTVGIEYGARAIAGSDTFFDETEGRIFNLDFNQSLQSITLDLSHDLLDVFMLHGVVGYDAYSIFLATKSLYGADFSYPLANGWRTGLFATFKGRVRSSRAHISPRGLILRLGYDFKSQNLLNDESTIMVGAPSEYRYDTYQYHQATVSAKGGIPALWYDRHDLYGELNAVALGLTDDTKKTIARQDVENSSWYQAAAWLPGYAYYYRDTLTRITRDSTSSGIVRDTVGVPAEKLTFAGNAIAWAKLSYRFPLYSRPLDLKLGFFYIDKLFGVINYNLGVAWQDLNEASTWNREQWSRWFSDQSLQSAGAELRCEAITFNTYPLALSLRYDYGMRRFSESRISGDRITLSIGFDFDYWSSIDNPNYFRPR